LNKFNFCNGKAARPDQHKGGAFGMSKRL